MKIKNEELELTIQNNNRCRSARQARRGRAAMWFARMREIVDNATDWQPIPPARPEQLDMVLAPAARVVRPAQTEVRATESRPEEKHLVE
ncbi:MAG TPA: hypothetical protein VLT36_15695 [Candidatus Dormibacteraeota bacterium]|nr:hypothetical protein [Candidatus Dormibacteraeota bacterium]